MGSRLSDGLTLWYVFMTLKVEHVIHLVQFSVAICAWRLFYDLFVTQSPLACVRLVACYLMFHLLCVSCLAPVA